MRKLLTIGLALGLALAFAHGDALARGGGQGGMRGGFGGGQAYAGNQYGAMQQYRYQNRARAMQCPYGNSLGYAQQQIPYSAAPAQVPFGGQFGTMEQQWMQQQLIQQQLMQQRMQQRRQRRVRAGQGGLGLQQEVPQAAQGQLGLGAGQCPFGNEPQALQQRNQVRARAGQNGAAAGSGSVQQRSRMRTRVPQ